MKILRQLAIILGVLFLGHLIQKGTGLPIPGTVIAMILLLISLQTGIVKVEMIEEVSQFLLKHLSFFFIPSAVGLISSLDLIEDNWLPILAVIAISTILVIVATSLTVQGLKRIQKGEKSIG